MFNKRKISQERVIGISFVDILIQAVFLLLLILMVGYVDPVLQLNFQFHEAGKDLCNKLNKDSPVACIEFVNGKKIVVSEPGVIHVDPSKDFCAKRKLSPENCKSMLDELSRDASLFPCIAPISKSQLSYSTYWIIHSPGEIEFDTFSTPYMRYLKEKGFDEKLKKVSAINLSGKKLYKPSEIDSTFGFIREDSCFHEYHIVRTGKFADLDLLKERAALRSLRVFEK